MGAKRLGGKRPGGKWLGGETTRGGNGLGAKRPGFRRNTTEYGVLFESALFEEIKQYAFEEGAH